MLALDGYSVYLHTYLKRHNAMARDVSIFSRSPNCQEPKTLASNASHLEHSTSKLHDMKSSRRFACFSNPGSELPLTR